MCHLPQRFSSGTSGQKTEGETANPGSPGKQLLKQRWWSGGVNKRTEAMGQIQEQVKVKVSHT